MKKKDYICFLRPSNMKEHDASACYERLKGNNKIGIILKEGPLDIKEGLIKLIKNHM